MELYIIKLALAYLVAIFLYTLPLRIILMAYDAPSQLWLFPNSKWWGKLF